MHRRAIARVVATRMREAPVVRITGARAVGKTTTALAEIESRGGSTVSLDDPDVRAAVAADPTGYLAALARPVLVDEYQRVPATLDVIKTDLEERGSEPGSWLLTGSVSLDTAAHAAGSLGGQLADVTMGTLTLDERNDRAEPRLLSRLLDEGVGFLRGRRSEVPPDRRDLLAEATRGGFPLVTDRKGAQARSRRLEDWVNASVIADGAAVGGVRNVEGFLRMLRLYAAATASIMPKDRLTADRLEVDRRTVARYRGLLAGLHVTWDLPALVPGNATGQVTKSAKLHLVDSGLVAALAGRDRARTLERDPAFAQSLVETTVVNDLRVQASVLDAPARLFHFREADQGVDLVVERSDGGLLGIEVSLRANPGARALAGLRRLRRSSGDRWVGGVVLCRVPAGRLEDEDLAVAPIDVVWSVCD